MFDLCSFDYIVDALGTISSKLLLIRRAAEAHVPLISCMDIGNKLDPSRLEIADIGRTTVREEYGSLRYCIPENVPQERNFSGEAEPW